MSINMALANVLGQLSIVFELFLEEHLSHASRPETRVLQCRLGESVFHRIICRPTAIQSSNEVTQ